jgi:hypothetical protein
VGDKEKGDKALAVFKKYKSDQYDADRQELLKHVQEAVKGQQ